MLRRTYKKDLKVTIVDNCLRVTCQFKDIYDKDRDFGKQISIDKPQSALILDEFFDDILQEIAWAKCGSLTSFAKAHEEYENNEI